MIHPNTRTYRQPSNHDEDDFFPFLYIVHYLENLVRKDDDGNTFQAMIEACKAAQLAGKTTYTEEKFMKGLKKVAVGCLGRLLGVRFS